MTEIGRSNDQKEAEGAENMRKKPTYKYDQETMLKISLLPASKVRPKCLPEEFDVVVQETENSVVKLWSPDLWIQSLWDQEDRNIASATAFRNGRARPAETDFRKRLGERIKSESEEVIGLSPQRRSFGAGCQANLATQNKRNISPHGGSKKDESTRNMSSYTSHDLGMDAGGGSLTGIRGRGRIQQRGDNWRDHQMNLRNKENKENRFRSSNWSSNNHRYDRRPNAAAPPPPAAKELPEWATYCPSEQDETMELHGFDDDVADTSDTDTKPAAPALSSVAATTTTTTTANSAADDVMKGSVLDSILLSASLVGDSSAGELLSKTPIDDMFAASADKFNMGNVSDAFDMKSDTVSQSRFTKFFGSLGNKSDLDVKSEENWRHSEPVASASGVCQGSAPKYVMSGGGGAEGPMKSIMDLLADGCNDRRGVNGLSSTSASQLLTIMGAKRVDEIEAGLRGASLQSPHHEAPTPSTKIGETPAGEGERRSSISAAAQDNMTIETRIRDGLSQEALQKLELLSQSLSHSQMGLSYDQDQDGITYQRQQRSVPPHESLVAGLGQSVDYLPQAAAAVLTQRAAAQIIASSNACGLGTLPPHQQQQKQQGLNREVFTAVASGDASLPGAGSKMPPAMVAEESLAAENMSKAASAQQQSMMGFPPAAISHSPTSFLPTSVMKQMHTYRNVVAAGRDGRGAVVNSGGGNAEQGSPDGTVRVSEMPAGRMAATQPLSVLTSRDDQQQQHCNQSVPFPAASFHPSCQNQMSPQDMARVMQQQRLLQEQLMQQQLLQQRIGIVTPLVAARNNPLYMQFIQAQAMQSQMAAMHHRPRLPVQSSPVRLNSNPVDVNMLRHRAAALSPQQQLVNQIRMRNSTAKDEFLGVRSADPLSQLFASNQRFPMPLIPAEAKAITLEELEKMQKQAAAQQ